MPIGTSCFFGTIVVSTVTPERRTNLTWLPLCPASAKPADSRRRLISRKGNGLSRPNLNLDQADLWWARCLRRLEVKFQGFFEVGERFIFRSALARHVELEALRDVPVPFFPDAGCKRTLHLSILSRSTSHHLAKVATMIAWFD